MLSARETCGGDMNGVGFNPFENMFFENTTISCVRAQTYLTSVAASRDEFSKTCERRDARNRSKAYNFPKSYFKLIPKYSPGIKIASKMTPRESPKLPRVPPESSPGRRGGPEALQCSGNVIQGCQKDDRGRSLGLPGPSKTKVSLTREHDFAKIT